MRIGLQALWRERVAAARWCRLDGLAEPAGRRLGACAVLIEGHADIAQERPALLGNLDLPAL